MASYILPREKLNLFLASLVGFQVWAPVTRDGSCSFEPVSGRLDSVEIDLQHQPLPAKKAVVAAPEVAKKAPASVGTGTKAVALSPDSAATIKKLTDSLRKMGDKRPTKPASLWRSLKSFLGTGATEESVEVALAHLIEDGVVKVDSVKGASYPRFDVHSRSPVSQG